MKGPGQLEPICEKCLIRELFLGEIPAKRQGVVAIEKKDRAVISCDAWWAGHESECGP